MNIFIDYTKSLMKKKIINKYYMIILCHNVFILN